jgi:hypothetical protein
MRCKLLGVLQTLQETKQHRIRNDRIIAVLEDSHREQELSDVQGLLLAARCFRYRPNPCRNAGVGSITHRW